MKKQESINKLVELYEKAITNIKNADKHTLWVVIALLFTALVFEKSIKNPDIIIQMPTTKVIPGGVVTYSTGIPEMSKDSYDIEVTTKDGWKHSNEVLQGTSNKAHKVNSESYASSSDVAINKFSNSIKKDNATPNNFLYCYTYTFVNDNPFKQENSKSITFVIDEQTNKDGKTYIKTTKWSDYEENDLDIETDDWYDSHKKIPCSKELILNNTKEKVFKRWKN